MTGKKKIRGEKRIISIIIIVAGGIIISSCNKETTPAGSLKAENEIILNNAYGSRYIQSPLTDQEKVVRLRRGLKLYPERIFIR